MNVTAGQRLRAWRESQRLSQQALADLIDEEQSTISRLERGEMGPSLRVAIELAKLARARGGRQRLPVDMWLRELQGSA